MVLERMGNYNGKSLVKPKPSDLKIGLVKMGRASLMSFLVICLYKIFLSNMVVRKMGKLSVLNVGVDDASSSIQVTSVK